jgi:hypothetical protein
MQQTAKAPASPVPPPAVAGAATNAVSPKDLTQADIQGAQRRKSELSDQLNSAKGRRDDLRRQITSSTNVADRTGLEARLGQLDQRIMRLESDIDENGKFLASPEATRFVASSTPPPSTGRGNRNVNVEPIAIVFTLFVLAPMALSLARIFWKRGSLPKAQVDPERDKRLERMEHAIDSIAIEVERVSEGQRFVTRILAEGQHAVPLAAGANASEAQRISR